MEIERKTEVFTESRVAWRNGILREFKSSIHFLRFPSSFEHYRCLVLPVPVPAAEATRQRGWPFGAHEVRSGLWRPLPFIIIIHFVKLIHKLTIDFCLYYNLLFSKEPSEF